MPKARLIALYLPQFHPIPENDEWWGKGFTEWTNTAKAKPLFIGHRQPNVPADLGFYDLRVPETREAQAELARTHGVEGFCYWHYWFGGGKRLLERPFNEVLASGKPDFPFCLAWANHTWSGVWHGCPDRVLIEQTYPGKDDIVAHFYAMLPAFRDPRYLTTQGKCIFAVYKPKDLKEPRLFIDTWRELASKEGLDGFHFIAMVDYPWEAIQDGYDAYTTNPPVSMVVQQHVEPLNNQIESEVLRWRIVSKEKPQLPQIYSYESFVRNAFPKKVRRPDFYPCVIPNWDNTPRSSLNGFVLHESTPALYERHLREAVDLVADREPDQRLVFVKSWNEWAESNYLEPDLRWGKAYLEATSLVVGAIDAAEYRSKKEPDAAEYPEKLVCSPEEENVKKNNKLDEDVEALERICDSSMKNYNAASARLRRIKCYKSVNNGIRSWDGTEILPFSVDEESPPWSAIELYQFDIPGMLHPEEKQYYQWISQFYSGMGEIIELGPWLGCSTNYIVKSYLQNPNFEKRKIYVYDDFVWRKSWMDKYIPEEERIENHQDFQFMFEKYTREISDHIEVSKCKFNDHDGNNNCPLLVWNGKPIEIMYIDCGRTIEANESWYQIFKKSFIPGKTLLIMQDWGVHREVPRKSYNQTWEFTESKGNALQLFHELKFGLISTFLYKG